MSADNGESQLRTALAALDEDDETTVDTGVSYRAGEPVLVRVRRRGHRYDISDDGTAVALTGKPDDWLHETERLVVVEGFNINRRGVIFVPAVKGRDIAALTLRLAAASRTVYLTLLDAAAVEA
ncbi:MAG: hypothetical protein M3070_06075 [Actinomycetota bacterium]|nr:hypothetical protein [Actinomycetota bacterium]